MTPCREYRESIAAFVLGALPAAEVTPLRAHLATCEECDRYHDEMTALPPLLDLAGGVDGAMVEAPAGLEDRIARRIAAESSGRRTRGRRLRRPLLAGVGGLALGAAVTLGVVFALGGFNGTARADAVDLAGTPMAPSAWGTANLQAGPHGTTIRFDADGMPPSKPGQHYEVWLTDGRHGISAGTFRVGADGKARCTLATAGRAEYFTKVDVTVEPDVPPRQSEHEDVILLGNI
jgi:hypothetical protein